MRQPSQRSPPHSPCHVIARVEYQVDSIRRLLEFGFTYPFIAAVVKLADDVRRGLQQAGEHIGARKLATVVGVANRLG